MTTNWTIVKQERTFTSFRATLSNTTLCIVAFPGKPWPPGMLIEVTRTVANVAQADLICQRLADFIEAWHAATSTTTATPTLQAVPGTQAA